jgi:phage FluMu protein Com
MGSRYIIEVECDSCGYEDNDAPYAPTSGFLDWQCPRCKKVIDLEAYTGIDAESTASTSYGVESVREQKGERREAW